MAPMAKITFKALLDWFLEINAKRWNIHVQASQFDAQEYMSTMSPVSGMICLNISASATRHFTVGDKSFSFWSRFQGKEIKLDIPYTAVFCAVDPDSGIPNTFPYFEDHGDVDLDLPDGLEPTAVEVLANGKHRLTFNNGTSADIEPLSDEELDELRSDIESRKLAALPVAVPASKVKVLNLDGTETEVQIPTMAEIDELNKTWREQGMSMQCDGFKIDENGKLVLMASAMKDDANVVKVDFGDKGNATFSGDATILNFPGKVEVNTFDDSQKKALGEWGKLLTHDTVETKMRDRHWTVIEGGKAKPVASMPWIDVIYREKLARREAAEKLKESLTFGQIAYLPCDEEGNLIGCKRSEIRSDGSNGESSFFPNLDVAKCTWPGKRVPRPDWLIVVKGGEHVAK